MNCVAVVIYTMMIIEAIVVMIETSSVVMSELCITNQMGTAKFWLTIEIWAYFINIAALVAVIILF